MKILRDNIMRLKFSKGFTLIELVVVMGIVGILTSIAVPAYRDYILRGQLTEGVTQLADMRVKLEQYFQDNRTYVGACVAGTLAPLPTGLRSFVLTCPTLTASTYIIDATGLSFDYTIDQSNARNTISVPTGWTLTAGCWVVKKSGDCQ